MIMIVQIVNNPWQSQNMPVLLEVLIDVVKLVILGFERGAYTYMATTLEEKSTLKNLIRMRKSRAIRGCGP